MTTNDRLAAIEENMPDSFAFIDHRDVRWLIAEVRDLTSENESVWEKVRELEVRLENANTAIGTWKGEYARGRADAVDSIVKLIQATGGRLDRLAFFLEATP